MSARVVRWVCRLVVAALILMLAVRTYEETAVALARSDGSLRTAEATIGAGTAAALVGLRANLRWARIPSVADTPGGSAQARG